MAYRCRIESITEPPNPLNLEVGFVVYDDLTPQVTRPGSCMVLVADTVNQAQSKIVAAATVIRDAMIADVTRATTRAQRAQSFVGQVLTI